MNCSGDEVYVEAEAERERWRTESEVRILAFYCMSGLRDAESR